MVVGCFFFSNYALFLLVLTVGPSFRNYRRQIKTP